MRVTSVRVETRGAHDHVTVWVDGANTGTLIVGAGQGEWLKGRLSDTEAPAGDHCWRDWCTSDQPCVHCESHAAPTEDQ